VREGIVTTKSSTSQITFSNGQTLEISKYPLVIVYSGILIIFITVFVWIPHILLSSYVIFKIYGYDVFNSFGGSVESFDDLMQNYHFQELPKEFRNFPNKKKIFWKYIKILSNKKIVYGKTNLEEMNIWCNKNSLLFEEFYPVKPESLIEYYSNKKNVIEQCHFHNTCSDEYILIGEIPTKRILKIQLYISSDAFILCFVPKKTISLHKVFLHDF
jgi:hypothetical protein